MKPFWMITLAALSTCMSSLAQDVPATETCGDISPSFQYIYGIEHDEDVIVLKEFDIPPPDQISMEEILENRPDRYRNLVIWEDIMDKSWGRSDSWFRSWGHRDFRYKRFSENEAECWAEVGDQVAQFMLGMEYLRIAQVTEEGDSINAEFLARSMDMLGRAGEVPDQVDSCETLGAACQANLLTPFPVGLPRANAIIATWIGRQPSIQVFFGDKTPEEFTLQAARGGYSYAYFGYYGISWEPQRTH